MILAEETDVALLVEEYFATLTDEHGRPYDQSQVMRIHTPDKQARFTDADLDRARKHLDAIDDDNDSLRVVISVLMLREGFDKTNICVIVVLRATEADLLLEQIVGRGLRLMFPEYRYPEFWDAKVEAVQDLRRRRMPSNSLDFLFIVEHPRFRAFYDELRQQGYLIGGGDTSKTRSTGDLIPIDAISERIPAYDIAWPVQIFEQGKLPDLTQIDVSRLPKYPTDFEQLKHMLAKLAVSDTHVDTGTRARTWKLDNQYFDFAFFLRQASHAIATAGKGSPILTAKYADIAALVDEYVSNHLFGKPIDFSLSENYHVLNFALVFDHVVEYLRRAILTACDQAQYSVRQGVWGRLSNLERITVRESRSVPTEKCIYPRQGYSAIGGGFERDFMTETLNTSPSVQAYAKLTRRHGLVIPYRDVDGIQRDYEVDFIAREPKAMYLIETKADKDLPTPSVALKARAAQAWCESASGISSPEDLPQPTHWEYLLLAEGLFKANRGLSFEALVPLCQALREKVIAQQQGKLF